MSIASVEFISDAINASRRGEQTLQYTQLSQKEQSYTGVRDLISNGAIRTEHTGYGIRRDLSFEGDRNAKIVGFYETDSYSPSSSFVPMTMDWVHITHNYSFDAKEEVMNSGNIERIQDYIREKRIQSRFDISEFLEGQVWTLPGTAGKPGIAGVPYWIVANASEGFNGGNNTNYAGGPGNVSAATHPEWNNYTAQYTSVSEADLVTKMRRAYHEIMFEAPEGIPNDDRSYPGHTQCAIYTKLDTLLALQTYAKNNNDQVGYDIDPANGQMRFNGVPIKRVPRWESTNAISTSDVNGNPWVNKSPVLMLNWSTWQLPVLSGRYMKEGAPEPAANQHDTVKVDIDNSMQLLCLNRRMNAVITTA